MSSTALFIFHEGMEELEVIAPLDILRRAGVYCTTATSGVQLEVTGKNGIILKADRLLSEVFEQPYDLLVIPGGPGVYPLRKEGRVTELAKQQAEAGKPVAAICAAPTILKDAELLEGKRYTAHFSVADELPDIETASAVVVDGNIITSRGAGTAVEFGLELARILTGPTIANEVAKSIHFLPA